MRVYKMYVNIVHVCNTVSRDVNNGEDPTTTQHEYIIFVCLDNLFLKYKNQAEPNLGHIALQKVSVQLVYIPCM